MKARTILKRKLFLKMMTFLSVWMLSCAAGIPVQFPRYPSGSTGSRLQSVLKGKKRIAVVARDLSPNISAQLSGSALAGEWQETTRGTVKKAFEGKGFYEIIDLDSRDLRYRELAHAQTGMTRNQLKIGQELAINALLFVQMTAKPRSECKREEVSKLSAQAMQLAMMAASKGEAGAEPPKQYAGVTYVTAFVQGTLVNVETGASVSYTSTSPYRLENDAGNLQCPSELTAFDGALQLAAEAIADRLSPEIVTLKIPLADDTDGLVGNTDRVEAYLEEGIKWAEAGDFEQASLSWERALSESGGRSSAALWNLAAYNWYAGDMDMAENYFGRSIRSAEPGWITSGKRFVYKKFKEEKERKLREGN